MKPVRGFSLLELLVVLAIVSVLLVAALPAYRQAIVRAQRAAAKVALMDVASRQEWHLLNYKRYGTSLAELGLEPEYYIGPTAEAASADRAVYRVELALEDGTFESVRAVPWNGQRGDTDCGTFTLDRWGRRGVSGDFAHQPARCW